VPDTARARQVAAKGGVAPDDGPPLGAEAGMSFDLSTGAFRTNRPCVQLEKSVMPE